MREREEDAHVAQWQQQQQHQQQQQQQNATHVCGVLPLKYVRQMPLIANKPGAIDESSALA
jgi:hypothetical protein